ncbi:MAG: hypothetical protein LUD27_05070 [Clostridia bacterium]|nr:hypothetical protein [Clostridia bacterium]
MAIFAFVCIFVVFDTQVGRGILQLHFVSLRMTDKKYFGRLAVLVAVSRVRAKRHSVHLIIKVFRYYGTDIAASPLWRLLAMTLLFRRFPSSVGFADTFYCVCLRYPEGRQGKLFGRTPRHSERSAKRAIEESREYSRKTKQKTAFKLQKFK